MNKIDYSNHICTLTIDNKPQNYLTDPEFVDMKKLEKLVKQKEIRAIVICGNGRHFSAGADPKSINTQIKNNKLKQKIENGKKLLQYIQSLQIPIIAAIEGVCFGGGLEIVLCADIRIASTKALFAFPETNINIIPGLGGIINTSKLAGQHIALEMILSGDMIDADRALEAGLIDEITTPKTTYTLAIEKAAKMTNNRSIQVIKSVVQLVRNTKLLDEKAAIEQETKTFCELAHQAAQNNDIEKNS